MAKSKALIAAELRIATLEATVAALEAKVSLARTLYRALRDSVREVQHAPVAPVSTPVSTPVAMRQQPIVTRYRDALGREWIKTRIGNRASSRLADAPVAPAYEEAPLTADAAINAGFYNNYADWCEDQSEEWHAAQHAAAS